MIGKNTTVIKFALSREAKINAEKSAKANKMNLSEYIRASIAGGKTIEKIQIPEEVNTHTKELIGLLNRINTNCNQIAKVHNYYAKVLENNKESEIMRLQNYVADVISLTKTILKETTEELSKLREGTGDLK